MAKKSNSGSDKAEEKTAGLIYLFFGLAVFISIILFFALGTNKLFSPQKASDETRSAPDRTPDTKLNSSPAPSPPSN